MKDTGENENPTALDFELQDETVVKDQNTVDPASSDHCDTNAEEVSEDIILQSLATIISDIYFKRVCSTNKKTKQ